MVDAQLLGVFDDRNRGRDALIARAGEDHDRLFAAAHARIRPGGSIGLCPLLDVVAVILEQDAPDLRAPCARQPLAGNGGIIGNLPLQKRVCLVTLLLTIFTAADAAMLGYTAFQGVAVSWSSLAFAPFITIVALILAWRGINADHKKIKNADRLWS